MGVGGVGMAPYFPKYGCNIKPTVKCGIGLETTPFLSKRTNFYSSLSQPFCPRETLEIIFRAWGTPAKPIQWRSVDNMPLVLVVSGKNAQLSVVVKIPPLQTANKITGVLLLALPNGVGSGTM